MLNLRAQELIEEESHHTEKDKPSLNSEPSTPRGMDLSPIRVDFGSTAPSSVSVLSESEHQKHVLQQYSINQQRTAPSEQKHLTPPTSQDAQLQLSPRSRALEDLRKTAKDAEARQMAENNSFNVPTPQLQFAEMWESQKSVPTISSSRLKPHSCKVIELDRQNLKVEPNMPPPPVVSAPSPSRVSDLLLENSEYYVPPYRHEQPVLHDAWTVARPNSSTKHSLLTSSRLTHYK